MGEYLRLKGFDVDFCETASETFNAMAKNRYDFCILGLDDLDEMLQLTSDIRLTSDTPLFAILPSKSSIVHAERSFEGKNCQLSLDAALSLFEAGVDDCLVQPLVPDLLICKMQAILRRWNNIQASLPTAFTFPGVHFDSVTQTLTFSHSSPSKGGGVGAADSASVLLSTEENSVLLLLCRNANRTVERARILKEVWRSDSYFCARTLSVYINRLRHILEPNSPLRIISMRTQGYKLLVP